MPIQHLSRLSLLAAVVSAAVGCGEVASYHDARPDDPEPDPDAGATVDAGVPADAAPPDAPPPPDPPPPGTARELAVIAGRASGGGFVLHVEVTGGVATLPAAGGAFALDPSTTVTLPPGGN